MCGITGIFHRSRDAEVDDRKLRAMTDLLQHRGPDDDGYYFGAGVGLGHRRLAIVDPESGKQPMRSAAGQVALVFNGEIYNYIELRDELAHLGHAFLTSSDTEVLLHAYLEWGADLHERLNGVWAFAIWDERSQELLLSRDRLGEKPLYYAAVGDCLVFASEPKCILKFGHRATANLSLVHLYLAFGYVPGEHSFFSGIDRLNPGEWLRAKRGAGIRRAQYWKPPIVDSKDMRRDAAAVESEFAELFDDSVRIRMRSDVPYGAFLSGGLDSTTVALKMGQHTKDAVKTFTIGFEGAEDDERELARQFATSVGTEHHDEALSPAAANASVDIVIDTFDEPFGDASAAAVSLVSKVARRHVKMVLSGDGGDEVLSGYNAYQSEKLIANVPKAIRPMFNGLSALSGLLSRHVPSKRARLQNFERLAATSSMSFVDRLAAKASWVDDRTLRTLLPALPSETVTPRDFLTSSLGDVAHLDGFYQLMHFNLRTSLPDDMLTKVDRMSMAHSLEVRAPFLDHRLVELMAGVHKNVKMRRFERKSVLKRTVGQGLPAPILHARKRGFSLPVDEWFRGSRLDAALLDSARRTAFGIDSQALRKLVDDHRSRRVSCGGFLWTLLVLLKWFETFN